jgi:hypothetical protein
MSLTKLYLAGNNYIISRQGQFGYCDILAGDGKNRKPFLQYSAAEFFRREFLRRRDFGKSSI